MARTPKVATGWESRHAGNCFIVREREGWVVSLLHSEGITGPSNFLVPYVMANGRKRPPLVKRLRHMLHGHITWLGDVRHVGKREVDTLLQVPDLGPLWRRGVRWDGGGPGNWNGRGRPYRDAGQSGLCWLTARTEHGWLVLLRSLWGTPCGSYLVPFRQLPFAARWDASFFVRPLRWNLTQLHGARTLTERQLERVRGWDVREELEDEAVA